jgi:hypothetical protein
VNLFPLFNLLQGVSEPAHDVFVEDDDIVSSIVVVPLLVNAQQFGGLYVTHEQPWSEGPGFAKAKELLVGLGAMLQRQLGQHLAGQPGAAWVDLLEVRSGDFGVARFWGFSCSLESVVAAVRCKIYVA